jgi:hypothetical protein
VWLVVIAGGGCVETGEEARRAKQNATVFGDIVDAYRRYKLGGGIRTDKPQKAGASFDAPAPG